jgi:uncharacterized protein
MASLLPDESRFHLVEGAECLWLWDGETMDLEAFPSDCGEEELAAACEERLGLEPLAAPEYRTRSRVSNLKLVLSSRCPSNCAYCFRDGSDAAPAPLGVGPRALEAMALDHGRDSGLIVAAYNMASEPLADLPALRELHEARCGLEDRLGKRINIYLCTSGTVQTPEALALVKEVLRGNRLGVSIDGPREVHDRYRKDAAGKGTYDRVLSLVRWAEDNGIGLEAQAVLTRSFPEPRLVFESILDLGFHSVTMKPVRPGFEASFREEDLPVLAASYDRLYESAARAFGRLDLPSIDAMKHDPFLKPFWKFALGTKAEGRCFWGSSHLVVDSRGDYYPCDSVVGRPGFRCGSIDGGIDWEAFHRDVSWRARKPCPDCWARSLCGGSCYVSGLTLAGDPLFVDPFECGLSRYFAERCLGFAAGLMEKGTEPRGLGPVLLRY